MYAHLLLHTDHTRPLLYQQPIGLLTEIGLKIGLSAYRTKRQYQALLLSTSHAHQVCLLLEFLKRSPKTRTAEIIQDGLVADAREL